MTMLDCSNAAKWQLQQAHLQHTNWTSIGHIGCIPKLPPPCAWSVGTYVGTTLWALGCIRARPCLCTLMT